MLAMIALNEGLCAADSAEFCAAFSEFCAADASMTPADGFVLSFFFVFFLGGCSSSSETSSSETSTKSKMGVRLRSLFATAILGASGSAAASAEPAE